MPTGIRTTRLVIIPKTVAAAATPELLGTDEILFDGITFYGAKGDAETPNAGTVYIQIQNAAGDWVSAFPVPVSGWSPEFASKTGSKMTAAKFRIKVGTNGDGVVGVATDKPSPLNRADHQRRDCEGGVTTQPGMPKHPLKMPYNDSPPVRIPTSPKTRPVWRCSYCNGIVVQGHPRHFTPFSLSSRPTVPPSHRLPHP